MNRITLTENFTEKIIGSVNILDDELQSITSLLSSGQFTFSSRFKQDTETGELTLMELSLIPIASLATFDIRLLNQKGSKKIFGVDSIFVDWNINNITERIRMSILRIELQELDTAIIKFMNYHPPAGNVHFDYIERLGEDLKRELIHVLIVLSHVAVGRAVTEKDVEEEITKWKFK